MESDFETESVVREEKEATGSGDKDDTEETGTSAVVSKCVVSAIKMLTMMRKVRMLSVRLRLDLCILGPAMTVMILTILPTRKVNVSRN